MYMDTVPDAALGIAQVRSMLELSRSLARQPESLAPQLAELVERLGQMLSARAAFGCATSKRPAVRGCRVHMGLRDSEVKTIFDRVERLSTAAQDGTATFRGDELVARRELELPHSAADPARSSSVAERIACCFRSEPEVVICLAFIRDFTREAFSGSELAIIDLVIGSAWSPPLSCPDSSSVSTRQAELLRLLKAGRSEKEAAREMRISVNTVHTHIKKIYQRFGVTSRQELLSLWIH